MFRPPFPAESYLLRSEHRYRWRDVAGRVDHDALAMSARLIPTAPELTTKQRAQITRVLDRVQKSAAAYPDLAAQGMLDERFGFPIIIEVPAGGIRRGVSNDGTAWETVFTGASYGFLPDTVARDAEEIDVIAGPNVDAPNVFVIAFLKPGNDEIASDGAVLDEHKLFIGFSDYEAAQACARANWPPDRIGGITVTPMEVLRGLMGFELDEGMIAKAIRVMTSDGVVMSGPNGFVVGRVAKVMPAATQALAPVTKGAANLATFAGGGLLLPGQGKPRRMRSKAVDDVLAKAERCSKAYSSACAYQGPVQYTGIPDTHPACTSPLTWEYDEPEEVGGWLGAIEPDDESWIAFVDNVGHALLWKERETNGRVLGTPLALARLDIATAKAIPERYGDIDFSPPDGVREAARRGIALHEEGKTGDGIEPATVAWARRIAAGEKVSPEKARQGNRWFGRNERFKDEPKDSPAWASWQLWFGDDGKAWFSKLVEQMDARDRGAGVDKNVDVDVMNSAGELVAKTIATVKLCAVSKGLDASTPIDRRIVYGVALESEPFDGRGDAHDETYSLDVVRRAAYNWLGNFANFDDSHGRFLSKQEIVVVESFIAPVEFTWQGTVIKQGSWVVAAKIVSEPLWARVIAGELNAWSIEGYAIRECTTCNARMKAKQTQNGPMWLCPSCDKLALLTS